MNVEVVCESGGDEARSVLVRKADDVLRSSRCSLIC